jgi:pimeloyl-ACP methyl ester carboxylesterase
MLSLSHPELPTKPHAIGTTELPDGRAMGWAAFGDPDGDAVFWFHGSPGARCQIPDDLHDEAVARRLRVIGVERPGTGDSTPFDYDQVVDFVADLEAVADDLGIHQFAAAGLSGGGPFVLACAHELPERMTAGMVMGGMGPTRGSDAVISYTLGLIPLAPALDAVRNPLSSAFGAIIRAMGPVGGPLVHAFFQFEVGDSTQMHAKPDTKNQLVADLSDAAWRSGLGAGLGDLVLFGRHWGFELGNIDVPVTFWAGTSDVIVPYVHAERQWKRIPGSHLRTMEGRGHFAGYTEVGDVLEEIRRLWPPVRAVKPAKKAGKKQTTKPAAKKTKKPAKTKDSATGS